MALKIGSNRYVVSFPPGLKEKAEVLAQTDGRTLNNWIMRLIEAGIRDGMRHMTINIEIRLKTGSIVAANRTDVDHKASVDRFIEKLQGRIGIFYPSSNRGIVPDEDIGQHVVGVHMYPSNADMEHMVQTDVEAMIGELLQEGTTWIVKRP